MDRYRLAIVASHVVQYQAPLYRLLAQHPDVEVTVLYCSPRGAERYLDTQMGTSVAWDVDLLSGYAYRMLRNVSLISTEGFLRLVNFDLRGALQEVRYDAVLFMDGWGTLSSWIGFAACLVDGVPIMLYGDSFEIPAESSLRSRVRGRILRELFRSTGAFMTSGTFNARYYEHYGADTARFFAMPWAIDNDRFAREGRLSPEDRARERVEMGLEQDSVVLLYSGKLVARKRPADLIDAVATMKHGKAVEIVFAGDGMLRAELETRARESGVRAHFPGFVNQRVLPRLYGLADAFILPSEFDPRATVVNEAMACGLPCVVTDHIGPSGDIVRDGDNGFVVPARDVAALASRLDTLAADPDLRAAMGRRSIEIIDRWSYREDVEGIVAALRFLGSRASRVLP